MTQTAPLTVPTKTPADLLREMAQTLDGYQPKVYGRDGVTVLPTLQAESDGVTLTLRCGEQTATFALCEDGALTPMLLGEGGYVLPEYLPERYRALAAVLPMEEENGWPLFNLAALAQPLGYRVLHSHVSIHIKHACTLHLLRLEHPRKGVVWGCMSTDDNPDGVIDDVLIIGGVPVARFHIEATHDDHALASMSDADLSNEGLRRPDPEIFLNVGTALTSERLRQVLNAVETGTVQFLKGEGL